MKKIFLSLGSNKGNRFENLIKCIKGLRKFILNMNFSSIYLTEPWGDVKGKEFLNMVLKGYTILSPYELLKLTQRIERELGRREKFMYTERTIDIDILFYEKLIIKRDELAVPHPLLHKRNFVIIPFCEIEPYFIHPIYNIRIKDFLKNGMEKGVKKIIDRNSLRT